jgi:hypothetical protein
VSSGSIACTLAHHGASAQMLCKLRKAAEVDGRQEIVEMYRMQEFHVLFQGLSASALEEGTQGRLSSS